MAPTGNHPDEYPVWGYKQRVTDEGYIVIDGPPPARVIHDEQGAGSDPVADAHAHLKSVADLTATLRDANPDAQPEPEHKSDAGSISYSDADTVPDTI